MVRCSVLGCKSDSEKKIAGLSFHSFPAKPDPREEWIKATKRNKWLPKKSSKICSRHFLNTSFMKVGNKTYLHPEAIPVEIPEDTSNYVQYKIMCLQEKQKVILHLKKGITPHKFQCQKNIESVPLTKKKPAKKKSQQNKIREAFSASLSKNTVRNPEPSRLSNVDFIECTSTSSSQVQILQVGAEDGNCDVSEQSPGAEDEELGQAKDEIFIEAEESRLGQQCYVCFGYISGGEEFVFTCIQCQNTHICKACFDDGHHSHHYVLRIPMDKPPDEVTLVVENLREQLKATAASIGIEQDHEQTVPKQEPIIQDPKARSHELEMLAAVKTEPDLELDPLLSSMEPRLDDFGYQCEETIDAFDVNDVIIKEENELYEIVLSNEDQPICSEEEPHKIQHHAKTIKSQGKYSNTKRRLRDDSEAGPSCKLKCYSGTLVKVEPLSAEESSGGSRVRDAASGSNVKIINMLNGDKRRCIKVNTDNVKGQKKKKR